MADAKRRYTDDVPEHVTTRVREVCLALPEAYEERAWVGTRWMVRKRTFAHLLGVEVAAAGPVVVLSFRSEGEELEVLRRAGHPFFTLGWGRDAMGMVLDDPDWDEVVELVTENPIRPVTIAGSAWAATWRGLRVTRISAAPEAMRQSRTPAASAWTAPSGHAAMQTRLPDRSASVHHSGACESSTTRPP